jgi:tRNA modification GTPase
VDCFAAVITGAGSGAIATIQVFGDSSQEILAKVFEPVGKKPAQFKTGQILLGDITDGGKTIDQVTIGCEAPGLFAIHSHGNPLIVEMIMQQLRNSGTTLLTAEQLRTKILTARESDNNIVVEAKLAQLKANTLLGTKIITNQIDAGLSKKAQDWLDNIDETLLQDIKTEAHRVLEASKVAKLIIYGCTAVLTGPPNSGKSTLLNCLAGRQKAIVTDIKGTTRDWVEATCRIGPLSLTLIDTAGLEEGFKNPQDTIEETAQKKTIEILKEADIVLLVLDKSRPFKKFDVPFSERIHDKKIITILNKADLPSQFDTCRLPEILSNSIKISAQEEVGINDLKQKILQTSGVTNFDPKQTIFFTDRQKNLLEQLAKARSIEGATSTITELLNGHYCV